MPPSTPGGCRSRTRYCEWAHLCPWTIDAGSVRLSFIDSFAERASDVRWRRRDDEKRKKRRKKKNKKEKEREKEREREKEIKRKKAVK